MKRETDNIRMDINRMMSILGKGDKNFSIGCYADIKKILPDKVAKEIDERRELDLRYNSSLSQIEIYAYDESHHNGNSYNEYSYNLDLNDYLEETIQKILGNLHDNLYDSIFNKEESLFIKEQVEKRIEEKYNL